MILTGHKYTRSSFFIRIEIYQIQRSPFSKLLYGFVDRSNMQWLFKMRSSFETLTEKPEIYYSKDFRREVFTELRRKW